MSSHITEKPERKLVKWLGVLAIIALSVLGIWYDYTIETAREFMSPLSMIMTPSVTIILVSAIALAFIGMFVGNFLGKIGSVFLLLTGTAFIIVSVESVVYFVETTLKYLYPFKELSTGFAVIGVVSFMVLIYTIVIKGIILWWPKHIDKHWNSPFFN